MKKTCLIVILVAFLAFCILMPAYAHSPYAIRQNIISDSDQNPLIVEKLFGDGILTASDPVRLQIRNKNGAVIAYTQTTSHVGVFCPNLKFCWAFPYDSSAIVEPMHLDDKILSFAAQDPKIPLKEIADYLSGKNNTLRYSGLTETYYSDKKTYHFSKGPDWLKWLSPFIILIDNFFASLVLAILFFLPFLLAPWYFAFAMLHNNLKKWTLLIAGALILILYSGFLLIVTLGVYLFNLALPILYCASIILISIFTGIYASKNFRIKPIANAFEKLDTDD